MNAIHTLLRNSIDYAGLFPPASLDLPTAVKNYSNYLRSENAWMLARFILPVARLSEFSSVFGRYAESAGGEPWRLAVLPGTDLDADLESIAEFNLRERMARIDTLEFKADTANRLETSLSRIPGHLQTYVEIPPGHDPDPLLAVLAGSGARAKVRTGGVTREAFPTSADLLGFMVSCINSRVPFKATAGLHHALRAEYPFTYAPDSARGTMFGFLNLFLAASFLRAGMDRALAAQVLEEDSPDSIQADSGGIRWNNHRLSSDDLHRARQEVIIAFGSCSFSEPVSELQSLHLLEPRVQQA
jgi:hypothetical protein